MRRSIVLTAALVAVLIGPAAPASAATGGLDTTFGTSGRVTVTAADDISFGTDGRLWISGAGRLSNGDLTMAQLRLDRNGHRDPSFAGSPNSGWESLSGGEAVTTPAGGAVSSWDLCCDTAAPSSWTVLRYNTASGRLADFGSFAGGFVQGPRTSPNGLPPWNQTGDGLIRLPDGRFRVCLSQGYLDEQPDDVVLWGLLADGRPDPAVGPNGLRVIPGLDACGTGASTDTRLPHSRACSPTAAAACTWSGVPAARSPRPWSAPT